MASHEFKTIFLTVVTSLGFSACSLLPSQTVYPLTQLQQVQNIDADPKAQANSATLSQYKDRCRIQFTGYFHGGESTETWEFQQQKLKRAFSESYQYDLSSPIQAATQKPRVNADSRTVTVFDIHQPEIKNNFAKLQSHFSPSALAQCQAKA